MKNRILNCIILILFFGVLVSSCKGQKKPEWDALEKTPPAKLQVPPIEDLTLDNGMKLFLLNDHSLPIVKGFLYIRTGSIYDPQDKVGLALLTSKLLRIGGTQNLSSEKINDMLDSLGAEINSEVSDEYGLITFQCLASDLQQVLKLVFEMIRYPAFEEDKISLIKLQVVDSLKRQEDSPDDLAMREFPKIIFGKDNEWSRTPTAKSIQSITKEDILQFYQQYYHPDRLYLGLSGDFSKEQVLSWLKENYTGWEKAKLALIPIKPLEKKWKNETWLIDKKIDQATILMGHFGDKRFNNDKYALLVLNHILGGDILISRLGKQIRSQLGLSYGVYSNFGLNTDLGIFYVFAQTKAESTSQVLTEIQKILNGIVEGSSLNDSELEMHKMAILNSLDAQYEPVSSFVKEEARFNYLGYPPNYFEIYREEIGKVSLEDIRRVAKQYIHPDSLQTLIIGDKEKIGEIPNSKNWEIESL